MKNKKRKKEYGFTMIETFVAITILLLSIAGPLTIASKGVVSAAFARDQIVAFHLAKEAVELVRNKRDENKILGNDWLDGLGNCISPKVCNVDPLNVTFSECVGGSCPPLNKNESTNIYSTETGSDWKETIFTREITINDNVTGNNEEISISITISWNTGILSKSFVVNENLFNWQ